MGETESLLKKANTIKSVMKGKTNKYSYCACGIQGWRIAMEDTHLCIPKLGVGDISLFAVFDGHGGPEVARFVEKHFPEELIKNENFEQGNYPESLSETLIQMDYLLETDEGHTEVKEYALETVNKKIDEELGTVVETRGCTATVALLVNENIYIANTGDCRLIISRGRGNVEQITIDQKPELEEEKKRVEKAGGVIMNGRIDGDINVSRSLGDFRYKNNTQLSREEQKLVPYPDIFSISRDGVDFLLIGCDGIYEMMDNSQLMEFIYAQYAEGVKDLETIVGLMIDKLVSPGPKKG